MGSMVKAETLNPLKLKAFLDAFSEISQRVLWKFGHNNETKLPRNVRTYNWMPQRSILEHPKVRVFITHGGMMGTQEAVYAGVPMLGIPLFADQMQNINNYVNKGIALQIDFDSITKCKIMESIRKLVNETR
ncbi:UDP-glucuronosyltransferase 2B23 [Blattella germanica]|nr:UDP-glucuronosyltransferase 2B23 [Blattella germanica]